MNRRNVELAVLVLGAFVVVALLPRRSAAGPQGGKAPVEGEKCNGLGWRWKWVDGRLVCGGDKWWWPW